MLNLLLRILGVVVLLIITVWIIGICLPRDFEVRASIEINRPREDVFAMINDLKKWPKWTSWNSESVESLTIEYHGSDSGEGAIQTWTEPRGEGKLWITRSEPSSNIEYESKFANFPLMSSQLTLTTSGENEDVCEVVWVSRGALPGGPMYGWFGGIFSGQMRSEYDRSLNRLKTLLETAGRLAPPSN